MDVFFNVQHFQFLRFKFINRKKKKKHNLKVEKCIYLVDLLRTYKWDTASQIALRDNYKEVRDEPRYLGFFSKNKTNHAVKHQKITVNHKNRDLKLMILALLSIWEDVSFLHLFILSVHALTIWGQYPISSIPLPFSVHCPGCPQWIDGFKAEISYVYHKFQKYI